MKLAGSHPNKFGRHPDWAFHWEPGRWRQIHRVIFEIVIRLQPVTSHRN
jgi:hypothetical protein